MEIRIPLTAMGPKGSRKWKWNAPVRAKMPTLAVDQCMALDRDRIKWFNPEEMRGLIPIFNVCGVKTERAWDLFHDMNFLGPVTTWHCSQLRPMWPHPTSRCSPFWEWWAAFCSYMGQMFDKTRDQLNIWRWDHPRVFGDAVDHSNWETTSSGKVTSAGGWFSWYSSDDPRAKIEPPRCWQYKPGNFVAMRPLK